MMSFSILFVLGGLIVVGLIIAGVIVLASSKS